MKIVNVNLVRFLLVSSLSSLLLLLISAQTDETNSTVTGKTNSTDVLAFQLIVDTFSILDVTEDPCLPEPYSWVKCSSDDTPRITEINLHGSSTLSLRGFLPDFSAMDALEKIDFGANILLAGEFPDFLANLPKLKVLYLVGTSFSGTVPTSLKKRSDEKTLTLMLSGMGTDLCYSDVDVCPVEPETDGTGTSPATETGTSPATATGTSPETDTGTSASRPTTSFTPPTQVKSRKKKTTPIVVGTLVPFFAIFWAIVGFLTVKHQKRKAAAAADLESAAQNISPDDQGVNSDQQTH